MQLELIKVTGNPREKHPSITFYFKNSKTSISLAWIPKFIKIEMECTTVYRKLSDFRIFQHLNSAHPKPLKDIIITIIITFFIVIIIIIIIIKSVKCYV